MLKLLILTLLLFAAAGYSRLIEQDPNIPKLFDFNFVNLGVSYTQKFVEKMVEESGPSQPPIFDSFNDPSIRQQLRKNVLLLIDKMLSMQDPNMDDCSIQRLEEAKALREIYMNDELFDHRPLPRYYHATSPQLVHPILDSMVLKHGSATFPGTWFATSFYGMTNLYRYRPVFSFGSELELPVSEVGKNSHYIIGYGPKDYFGLSRLHDVPMWKGYTNIVQWAVLQESLNYTKSYILSQYDAEKASYLLSRLVPIDQIVLERQLLTIAHAHTNDRANALLLSTLYISDLPRKADKNVTMGQRQIKDLNQRMSLNANYVHRWEFNNLFLVIIYDPSFGSDMYYGMAVSFNASSNQISYLTLQVSNRETRYAELLSPNRVIMDKYVPDIEMNDMTVLLQLIADGKLLDQPPASTVNLERSVKLMMTRARVQKVTLEQLKQQRQVAEKYRDFYQREYLKG